MKKTCIINFNSFGFVNVSEEATTIEKDKEYTLEEQYDDKIKTKYYNVIDNDEVITTISESELNTFFKN